jgi:hypothetical protein
MLDFIRKNVDDNDQDKDGEKKREGRLFVLCDMFRFLQNPIEPKIERLLRVVANEIVRVYSTVIIISPELHIPSSLEKRISIVDYDYPTADEIGAHLDYLVDNVKTIKRFENFNINKEQRESVIKATQGLTLQEADNAYSKSLVELRDILPKKIIEEKKQIIRKSGLLEFFETNDSMENIGGMKYLIEWRKGIRVAISVWSYPHGYPGMWQVAGRKSYGNGMGNAASPTRYRARIRRLRWRFGTQYP